MSNRDKLGEILVKGKELTEEQLKKAKIMHDNIGGEFGALLVKLGYTTDEVVTKAKASLEGIQTVDISSLVIPQKLVSSIPRDVIEKHSVIPISKRGGHLVLAMSDINDFEAIEEIQFLTGFRIEPVLAPREAIRKAIVQFYYSQESETPKSADQAPSEEREGSEVSSDSNDAPEIWELKRALIPLLIDKGVITEEELIKKAREISATE